MEIGNFRMFIVKEVRILYFFIYIDVIIRIIGCFLKFFLIVKLFFRWLSGIYKLNNMLVYEIFGCMIYWK